LAPPLEGRRVKLAAVKLLPSTGSEKVAETVALAATSTAFEAGVVESTVGRVVSGT
jgi:hypothetical protein